MSDSYNDNLEERGKREKEREILKTNLVLSLLLYT